MRSEQRTLEISNERRKAYEKEEMRSVRWTMQRNTRSGATQFLRWWKRCVRFDQGHTKIKYVFGCAEESEIGKFSSRATSQRCHQSRGPGSGSIAPSFVFFLRAGAKQTHKIINSTMIINDIETILIYLENKCQMPPTEYDAFCWAVVHTTYLSTIYREVLWHFLRGFRRDVQPSAAKETRTWNANNRHEIRKLTWTAHWLPSIAFIERTTSISSNPCKMWALARARACVHISQRWIF